MVETERTGFFRLNNPIMWACLATVGFAVMILWFAFAPTCNEDLFPKGDCPPKWRHLYIAPPNEVGDTLAGLAGVLAFIWLIATVLLQSVELGEQRRVLALQRIEMEEQRKATQDMARAMAAQANVFEDEQRARDETRTKNLLWEQLRGLSDSIDLCARKSGGWEIDQSTRENGIFGETFDSFLLSFLPRASEASTDIHIKETYNKLSQAATDLGKYRSRMISKPTKIPELLRLRSNLERTILTVAKASEDQIEFVQNLKIKETLELLDAFLSDREIWEEAV